MNKLKEAVDVIDLAITVKARMTNNLVMAEAWKTIKDFIQVKQDEVYLLIAISRIESKLQKLISPNPMEEEILIICRDAQARKGK